MPRDSTSVVSALTGLGPIETNLLTTYCAVGALSDGLFLKNARILEVLDDAHQIAPLFGYRVLCDLARPYVSHLRLVDFNGNYGSPDFSEASARYTESRLTTLGDVALEAENALCPAVPIGLVNGTTHVDGPMPPFDPGRVVAALVAANDGASDEELIATIGLPSFPTGCAVIADLERFASGEPTELRLEARIESVDDTILHISRLPPRSSPSDTGIAIERMARGSHASADFPIADVNDASQRGETLIVVRVLDGADTPAVVRNLTAVWGVHRTMKVKLGRPLPTLLRAWLADHGTNDLTGQLAPLVASTSN